MNIKLNDRVEIINYQFIGTDFDISGWLGEVVRIDFIKRTVFVNLDKEHILDLSKDKLIELDRFGFHTKNFEIPIENIKIIEESTEKDYVANIDEIYPIRIFAKTNIISSMTLGSIALFPFVFTIVGIILNTLHYIKYLNDPIESNIQDVNTFYLKSILLILTSILTGMILIKGIKEFENIIRLNVYGKIVKTKIKNIYSAKRKNKIREYIVYETINGIEIHQKIHWSKLENIWIGKEITAKYFDENPSISVAIDI